MCFSNFTMESNVKQRISLKFCYSNGISSSDALKMLQKAFGESALSCTRVFDWCKSFKEGRTLVENMPHDRRRATSINEENYFGFWIRPLNRTSLLFLLIIAK